MIIVFLYFMFWPRLFDFPEEFVRNIATVMFIVTVAGPSKILGNLWPSLPWGNH